MTDLAVVFWAIAVIGGPILMLLVLALSIHHWRRYRRRRHGPGPDLGPE